MRDKVLIRSAESKDAAAIRAIYAPYVEQTAITFDYNVPTVEDFQEKIQKVQAAYPFLVAEREGQVLGYAYGSPYYGRAAYDWTVELSIYVAEEARGLKVGSQLYDVLEGVLKAKGKKNFLACLSLPNEASLVFHQKRGYEQVAHFKKVGYKFGQWHDIIWLQKSLVEE